MASISTVVKVTITKGTRTVSLQAFNIPAIFGPSNRFVDPFKIYINPDDMLTDGFLSSDPEYVHAVALTSQAITPDEFVVSKFSAPVAQVETVSITAVVNITLYRVTLNSVNCDYTSDGSATGAEIQAGLIAAINGSSQAPFLTATAGAGTDVVVTSDELGLGFSITVGTNLSVAHTTPNHSIVNDIQTLQGINSIWYGVLVTSKTSSDIRQVAKFIESQLLIYISASSDAGIITSSTSDLASQLAALNYTRTALLYSATAVAAPDAAWMGYMLPTTPGIGNWKFKQLAGQVTDDLDSTQIFNAQSKHCNVYVTIGGVGTTLEGVCTGGEFIDVTIFIDWLKANMQSSVFAVLVDPNNLKIPYTNKGIIAIENPMRATLQQGQDNQGLAAGWTVTVPDVSTVPTADKKSRTLNNMKFQAQLAGAINKVVIDGFVSV